MRGLWMFMMLVGSMLSRAAKSQSTGTCHDELKTVCVPEGGDTLVPCPNLTSDVIEFRLSKGGKPMFDYKFERKRNHESRNGRADLEVLENTENNTLNFRLIGINNSSHGIYKCEGHTVYPPPKGILHNNQSILLLVEGHQCKLKCEPVKEVHCGFTWMVVAVVVSAYALFISIFAVVSWVKLRQTDTQSDYVNTKPPAPRGYRRKT